MKAADWPLLACVAHPSGLLQKILQEANKHSFTFESAPSVTKNISMLRQPVLRLFDEETSGGGLKSWDVTVLRGNIYDTITHNAISHRDAAKVIIIPHSDSESLSHPFKKNLTPALIRSLALTLDPNLDPNPILQAVATVPVPISGWRPRELVIETLFEQVLTLNIRNCIL